VDTNAKGLNAHASVAALREDTREWWADMLARHPDKQGTEPATADEAGLRRFLENEVLPWFETRKEQLANRPLICSRHSARRSTPTSSTGSVATRSTSTANSNGCWPCSCGSGTYGRGRLRADPFGKRPCQAIML
jgi:hypothetical protein